MKFLGSEDITSLEVWYNMISCWKNLAFVWHKGGLVSVALRGFGSSPFEVPTLHCAATTSLLMLGEKVILGEGYGRGKGQRKFAELTWCLLHVFLSFFLRI